MMRSMMTDPVPSNSVVKQTRNRGFSMLVIAMLATLLALAVVGAFSPTAMLVAAGVLFVLLSVRLVWLVRRELQ